MTLKVTSDMVTSLDASKLSGSMPTVDGSSLTNVNVSFADDTNSSDPLANTNPAGGVGSIWMNNSTGQVFICTDATTDENVWTNVGGGSGDVKPWSFHGTIAGYVSGGSNGGATNVIDTFNFGSANNATDHGDLTAVAQQHAGCSSTTHGFPVQVVFNQTINKFDFSTAGNATDHGDLIMDTYQSVGISSQNYGFVAGGNPYPGITQIDKFAYDSNTTASSHGDLNTGRYEGAAGISSPTHGYAAGGVGPNPHTTIDKFAFDSNVTATEHGNLSLPSSYSCGQNSETHGYVTSRHTSFGGYLRGIHKFALSGSGVSSSLHGELSVDRSDSGGHSSITDGYTSGGNNASPYANIIDKFSFATEADAVDHGDLTRTAGWTVGHQY